MGWHTRIRQPHEGAHASTPDAHFHALAVDVLASALSLVRKAVRLRRPGHGGVPVLVAAAKTEMAVAHGLIERRHFRSPAAGVAMFGLSGLSLEALSGHIDEVARDLADLGHETDVEGARELLAAADRTSLTA